jgi:PAS domain S-box-containing protein
LRAAHPAFYVLVFPIFKLCPDQLTQEVNSDDGTHTLTLYDAANQYAWTSATISFDANGNITGVADDMRLPWGVRDMPRSSAPTTESDLSVPTDRPDRDPHFRALITAAVDGVIVIDPDGTISVFNDACVRLFGYHAEDAIGRNVMMLMPAPYRDKHNQYLSDYLGTGEQKIIGIGREVKGQRKDGSTFPMYLSVGEGLAENRKFFVGIIRDLTQLNTEVALREDIYRLLSQIVRSSDDAILSKTLDGVITSWNGAAGRFLDTAPPKRSVATYRF